MKQSFLDFIYERKINQEQRNLLFESFNKKDINKVLNLIENLLKKHISGLIPLDDFVETIIDDKNCYSKQYLVVPQDKDYKNTTMFQFNWLTETGSAEIYSIDFFKDMNVYWKGEGKSDLTIYTLGTSIVRILPIIWKVIETNDYHITSDEVEKESSKIFNNVKESKVSFEKLEYTILENLSDNIIKESFIAESEATDYRRQKSKEITDAEKNNEDPEIIKSLKKEYAAICKAINSGAETIEEVKVSIANNKSIKVKVDKSISDAEKELEKPKKEPNQIFKEMSKYINLVIKGLQTSLILCGAPGVGKTFRVKKELKSHGYVEGNNLCTIKGKCTARRLYLSLYEMKEKGDIVLIDDADSLVGPQADENCINILKAALDSSTDPEGRLVTYGVAGKIMDDDGNEIPKRFYCKNGVIVITNYHAGALDTALRNRSFIQDINFTNEDVLKIIEELLPDIETSILDPQSKLKSFRYLSELNKNGSDMELSLRTFVLCAKIFKACDSDSDFTDDDAKSMIEEQMRLQYSRAGKNAKY